MNGCTMTKIVSENMKKCKKCVWNKNNVCLFPKCKKGIEKK